MKFLTTITILGSLVSLSMILAINAPNTDLLAPLNDIDIILPGNTKNPVAPPTSNRGGGQQQQPSSASSAAAPRANNPKPPPSPPRQAAAAASIDLAPINPGNPTRSNTNDAAANILRFDQNSSPDGTYQYAFETDNGIDVQEKGEPKFVDDVQILNVQGAYSYIAPDGQSISVTYVANENGFQPVGAHIPVAPPIPEAIQRALDYIAAHPPKNDA